MWTVSARRPQRQIAGHVFCLLCRVEALDGYAQRRIDTVGLRQETRDHKRERRALHQFCSVKFTVMVISTDTGTPFNSVGV